MKASGAVKIEELPAVYEKVCGAPWFKSFEARVLKIYAAKQLDERIELSEAAKQLRIRQAL